MTEASDGGKYEADMATQANLTAKQTHPHSWTHASKAHQAPQEAGWFAVVEWKTQGAEHRPACEGLTCGLTSLLLQAERSREAATGTEMHRSSRLVHTLFS